MNAYISGTGTGQRSLASDDINGVKYIYSSMSSSMPRIDNVSVSGNTVTITRWWIFFINKPRVADERPT